MDHPRGDPVAVSWGPSMAAYGEIPMAAVTVTAAGTRDVPQARFADQPQRVI